MPEPRLWNLGFRPGHVTRMEVLVQGLDRGKYAAIFSGGFVGAIARVALVQTLPNGMAGWPFSTWMLESERGCPAYDHGGW